MGKKLYVGNLPFSIREQELHDMFAQCGQVESAKVITDRDTGRSKGFGFVEMSSEEEANQAIAKFNGNDLQGRPLNVTEAKPQAPRERGSFDRGGFGGGSGGGSRGGFGGGGSRGGNRDGGGGGFSKRGF
jgi:RNA recognition motif-containing protein